MEDPRLIFCDSLEGERGMAINTDFLDRCITTLESAVELLHKHDRSEVLYDIYRAAAVKEFEIILEQSGNLLKKRLRPYFASNRQVDRLTFKNTFRYAGRHGLISPDTVECWFTYRDNRNDTAHNYYGEKFAEETLRLLPSFILDAREMVRILAAGDDGP